MEIAGERVYEGPKVTLRRILSHTAGLTVHGFPGYEAGGPVPTLLQVLDGTKPVNTPAIRVNVVPGTIWRYSGGGYTIMQQMVIDTTGKPFPEFMRNTVLDLLGMTNSTYEQPLPQNLAPLAATGHYLSGFVWPTAKPVPGKWHVYPEMAAAGLWTTASDLARFVIAVQRALAGSSNPVVSQATMRQMLTVQLPSTDDGLGLFIRNEGKAIIFSHNGRDEGFDAFMEGSSSGWGVVILINANENFGAVADFAKVVEEHYASKQAGGSD